MTLKVRVAAMSCTLSFKDKIYMEITGKPQKDKKTK